MSDIIGVVVGRLKQSEREQIVSRKYTSGKKKYIMCIFLKRKVGASNPIYELNKHNLCRFSSINYTHKYNERRTNVPNVLNDEWP